MEESKLYLQNYVGKIFNDDIKKELETIYFPYKVELFDDYGCHCEILLKGAIRVTINNNIIKKIDFN